MKKTRGEELVALSDTIKILNDDDALDLRSRQRGPDPKDNSLVRKEPSTYKEFHSTLATQLDYNFTNSDSRNKPVCFLFKTNILPEGLTLYFLVDVC